MMTLTHTLFLRTGTRLRALALTGIASLVMAFAAAVAPSSAHAANPLITPAELKVAIERRSVLVLDIRELTQGDGKTPNYAAGHIPGAVAAPYSSIRGPESNPGKVPSDQELTNLFQQWGVTPSSHVVIAHTGADPSDFGGAARFYWTLKLAGVQKISILDGGFGAWGALKYPIETAPARVTPSAFQVRLDRRQIPTTASLAQELKSNRSSKLLLTDSRPEDYFTGAEKHSSAARAGTLPGAKHFDHEEWFQLNTGKLLSRPELQALAKGAGLMPDRDVVTFCNTGHWSATTWFVLSEMLQHPNVRMYPDSAVGWSTSRQPMDNEPSRAKVLGDQLKQAISNLKN
jgi:thiosulfate/3-mercaptopyruvate sulfurtransferase